MTDQLQQHHAEKIRTMARIREIDRQTEALSREREQLIHREAELGGVIATLEREQRPHVSDASVDEGGEA